ncbi:MAG: phosphoenolpyruvate synthase [Desulfovibrio sp.]|jgi:pyruvate,water dikinase|nr:phosphoenolpyruvate synthase [Desulfovibrio sp.]
MMLSLLRRLFGGKPAVGDGRGEESAHEAAFRERLQERCERFRHLLSANKKALEAMSDMEERLAGGAPFGAGYLQTAVERVAEPVQTMVRELNALSDNRYASLNDSFKRVSARMTEIADVGRNDSGPAQGPLVMPLAEIRLADLPLVGGKMANLGEVRARLGLPVPDGFAVTTSAYYAFMRHNNLHGGFARRIAATDMDNLDEVFRLSTDLQHGVLAEPLPPELDKAITEAVNSMKEKTGDLLLALRSSAVGEDSLGVTFAGQYRSELHVPPDEACDVWKEIIASKYSVTAMTYRFQRGIPDDAAPMCVGVLSMVEARAGGVAYSRDPVAAAQGREQVLLNAVRGMPKAVVDGTVTPDVFIFNRDNPPCLLEKLLADNTRGSGASAGAISDNQARRIADTALALESYYDEPQDMEWAYDVNGRMVVLQTRPLRESTRGAPTQEARNGTALPPGLVVLAEGGVPVSPGVGTGPVFVGRKQADMLSFPAGGILVVGHAHPRWATLLSRAVGLVSETGGMAGHLASVAREYRLPALFSLKNACALLENAGEVTLDAERAVVFAGKHPEIVPSAGEPDNLMAGSPVQRRLQEIGRLVVPLHLLDPDSVEFTPENCRSLHDVTRFCHEKAVRVMFDDDGVGRRIGRQLKAGAKLQYWVVDMGGGFTKRVTGPVVDIAEIASVPMLALWDGMTAVPWAGPPAAGAAGFMSLVFESAMNPELEEAAPTVMTDRNFFIISARYMILQARYGYHLCTVECLADENRHENFVSFQFKGGAADRERRHLRAAMIASLLEENGFRTDVKSDALFAAAEGFDAETTLRKIRLLGYLLIHTRQVDMIMRETGRAKALRQKLRADMVALAEKPLRFYGDSVT